MEIDEMSEPSEREIGLVEWGRFTEAVRELRRRFDELERLLGKRCTDCLLAPSVADMKKKVDEHEQRLRYLELKVAGAAGAATVLIQLLFKYIN